MIISNNKKYIFIHIPKCAGMSLTRALAPFCEWNDLVLGSTEFGTEIQSAYNKKFGLEKHSPVRDVVRVVGEEIWSEYFTFTVVRNPFSRIVSWYTFAERIYTNQNYLRRKAPWLYELLDKPLKTSAPIVNAYKETESFSQFLRHEDCFEDNGTSPQVEWLKREAEEDGISVDYLGRVESMEEDFRRICKRIGVEASLPRENVSSTKSYEQFYESEADARITRDRYAEDFELLQYEQTLPVQ